jgi:hypothetical protein
LKDKQFIQLFVIFILKDYLRTSEIELYAIAAIKIFNLKFISMQKSALKYETEEIRDQNGKIRDKKFNIFVL